MQKVVTPLFISVGLLLSGVAAQAQLSLPGKTLQKAGQSRAGLQQPAKNVKNVLGPVVSCPHIGKTLRELLNYARFNFPSIYRQALGLRRTGFSQPQVRDFLENAICISEGF